MLVDQDALIAYAEGELPIEQTIMVAATVAGDPRLGAQVTRMRQMTDALRATYESVLDEPIPAHLLALLEEAPKPPTEPVSG